MARHGQPLGADHESALYEEAEACTLSQLDLAVVRECVNRKLVVPVHQGGKDYFTGADVLKLKLLRTLLLSRQLSATLDKAFLRVGRDLMEQPVAAVGGNNLLDEVVDHLMKRLKRD